MQTLTKIWLALLALTVLEVALAFPRLAPAVFLLLLLALSAGKSAIIIAWFMHLKYERWTLTAVLFPLLILLMVCLLVFLPDAFRAQAMQ